MVASYFAARLLKTNRGFHDTRQATQVHEDAIELVDTDGSVLWEAQGHEAVYYVGHDHEFRGYIATRRGLWILSASISIT